MSQHVGAFAPPAPTEYHDFFAHYISLVRDGDIFEQFESQINEVGRVLGAIDERAASVLHDPYTWTIKQVVGHLIDGERVFGYRVLRFGNGDDRPIIGMEQNPWVEAADYETPKLVALTEELQLSRRTNLCYLKRISPEVWCRGGLVDGSKMTVRALAYIMVGHIIHHLEIIKTRVS